MDTSWAWTLKEDDRQELPRASGLAVRGFRPERQPPRLENLPGDVLENVKHHWRVAQKPDSPEGTGSQTKRLFLRSSPLLMGLLWWCTHRHWKRDARMQGFGPRTKRPTL